MTDVGQLQPGALFAGYYRIERLLKAGGMGAVYVVVHERTGKRQALKVMQPEIVADPKARARFEQEARVASLVDVPKHIVDVAHAGVDESTGMPFIVMELLVGQELGDWLEGHGRASPAQVVDWLRQAARALDRAHGKGVVHRDLKPENLFLVTREDEPPTIKILDFGIAKILQGVSLHVTGAAGTPLYMAPEQTSRSAEISPATDIWALGLIAYTLVVGRSYWHGEDMHQVMREILVDPFEHPSARAARARVALPPSFDAWMLRCIDRTPANRFQRAGEAVEALAAALGFPSRDAPGSRPDALAPTALPSEARPGAPGAPLPPVAATVTGQPVTLPPLAGTPGVVRTEYAPPVAGPLGHVIPPAPSSSAHAAATRRRTTVWLSVAGGLALVGALIAMVQALLLGKKAPADLAGSASSAAATGAPTLCPSTPRLLASLKGTVTADVFLTRGLHQLDVYDAYVEGLMREYERQSQGHFRYTIIDATDEGTKTRAKDLGLKNTPFGEALDGGRAMVVDGFLGIAFAYGGERGVIATLAPDAPRGLEFWMNNKIRELRARAEKRVYHFGVLAGHGDIGLHESNLVPRSQGLFTLGAIIEQNFPYYVFTDVDLSASSAAIDPSLDGLIVTQPSTKVSDADLARIDQFILRGKSAAFFVGAANAAPADPTMRLVLDDHGMQHLLAGYGVGLVDGLVVDEDSSASVGGVTPDGGVARLALKLFPVVRNTGEVGPQPLDSASPVFFQLTEVAFPLASPLLVHRPTQPEATFRELAHTSSRAVKVTDRVIDPHPLTNQWSASGPSGTATLAVSVEGPLRSAFDNTRPGTGRSRLLVVSSSQFLANPLARALNPPPGALPPRKPATLSSQQSSLQNVATTYARDELTTTILVFKNTLDWLSLEDDFVDCSIADDHDGGR
jgi:tRNA A-37 threonylcarbamoyl transferase component Bud32